MNVDELFELEDVDWDENWESYVALKVCVVFPRLILTEPLETSHGDDQVNTCAVATTTTTTPTPCFPKRVVNDNFIKKAVLERVPKNTIRSTNWGVRVFEAWCVERQCTSSVVDMSDKDLDSNISVCPRGSKERRHSIPTKLTVPGGCVHTTTSQGIGPSRSILFRFSYV